MEESLGKTEMELVSVNRQLAGLVQKPQLELSSGGGKSLEDPLWVWGIIGGKNVGKSTLINALAGGEVIDRGDDVGEGTCRPEVFVCSEDFVALKKRFSGLASASIGYNEDAPVSMRGLALVDLPDFDSLFSVHVDTVRDIASRLDGVIWVTTPKKVGDLRAINEIHRVLKARTNFTYVVNKLDWLLSQSNLDPMGELQRARLALQAQIAECDPHCDPERLFLIAAKHTTADSMLQAIAEYRFGEKAESSRIDGELPAVVKQVVSDFQRLKQVLTRAPSAEAAAANKKANLSYQVQVQAGQLLEYYQPDRLLERIDRALAPEALSDLADSFLPQAYCAAVVNRLNNHRSLFMDWSSRLFEKRIANWPLLGLIAWPVVFSGTLIGGIRSALPARAGDWNDDPFRVSGIPLVDRIEGLMAGVRSRVAAVNEQVSVEIPEPDALATQFRSDVTALTEECRDTIISPFLQKRPGIFGRMFRWVLPVFILLWFPLVQPILAGILKLASEGTQFDLHVAVTVVEALSGSAVLVGLCVSLLIMSAMTAAIYSRSVRDTHRAIDTLLKASRESTSYLMQTPIIETAVRPVRALRKKLEDLIKVIRKAEKT